MSFGNARRSWVKASRPPAEAPIPTIGERGDDATSCPISCPRPSEGRNPDVDAGIALLRLGPRRTDDRDVDFRRILWLAHERGARRAIPFIHPRIPFVRTTRGQHILHARPQPRKAPDIVTENRFPTTTPGGRVDHGGGARGRSVRAPLRQSRDTAPLRKTLQPTNISNPQRHRLGKLGVPARPAAVPLGATHWTLVHPRARVDRAIIGTGTGWTNVANETLERLRPGHHRRRGSAGDPQRCHRERCRGPVVCPRDSRRAFHQGRRRRLPRSGRRFVARCV